MKVKELIKILKKINQEADVDVVAHYKSYDFTICCGGSDGCTDKTCDTLSFYVDELCKNENFYVDELDDE
jgi:hypothetical protein